MKFIFIQKIIVKSIYTYKKLFTNIYICILKIFTLLFKFYCLNVKDKIEIKIKTEITKKYS